MKRIITLVVLVALLAAACGSSGKDLDEPESGAEPQSSAEAEGGTESGSTEPENGAPTETGIYPPNDSDELAAIFDPLLEPYGVRFTRGSLNDTTQGGYEPSDTGNHLALYVEPIGEYSDSDYLDGLYTISALATPFVFETWEGLTSYDICQEPRPEENSEEAPPPLTQINIQRSAAESFDWANGDLESMLQHAHDVGGENFSVIVGPPVSDLPEFRALTDEIFRS